jgi:hypothetical protein
MVGFARLVRGGLEPGRWEFARREGIALPGSVPRNGEGGDVMTTSMVNGSVDQLAEVQGADGPARVGDGLKIKVTRIEALRLTGWCGDPTIDCGS